jgi:hypothetical protein
MNSKNLFYTFLLGLFILVSLGFATTKIVKTKITEGISVSLPDQFFPMTPEDITQRFPSVRAPLGAYTTEDRVIDFSVSISATQWPDSNLEMSEKFFKAGIYNLYDKVEMVTEGIQEIHKKKFIFFEFDSRTNPDRRMEGSSSPLLKYTYIQYLIEPNRTLVFAFSCPRENKQEWQEKAHDIMKSIRVK